MITPSHGPERQTEAIAKPVEDLLSSETAAFYRAMLQAFCDWKRAVDR